METSSSDSYYIELLNTIVVRIYGYGNPVIYILGTIGNLISIAIFLKKKWRKNVCVFYFLICLLLGLIYLNCIVLGTTFITGWSINIQNSSVLLCKLMIYLSFVTSTLIPTVLILASIDRLLISSQNVNTRLYSSKRLAYFLISISTVFWMIFNIHTLIKVNIQQFGISYFVCYYDLSPFYLNFVNYSSMIINCIFCLLMIILSALSLKNVRRIRCVPRQQRRVVRSMTKKDFQLLRCLFAQNGIYISVSIISTLYAVYKVTTTYQRRTPLQQASVDFLDSLFIFVYFIFYCSTFFIFVCVSKAFRQEIKQFIYQMVGKDLAALRGGEEEHQQENLEKNNVELNIGVVSAIVFRS